MSDVVNNPPHYKGDGIEAIQVIEAFGLGFHLGNVVKYVLRAGKKDELKKDLRKAAWYLARKLSSVDAEDEGYASDDPANYSLCYLATPYTKYPLGQQLAFRHAAQLAAKLLERGVKVYSPIAHTHPLAEYSGLDPLDHAIWLPFDQAMMDAADALIVAHMDGWAESYGVKHEIEFFLRAGKPIFDIDPQSLAVSLRGQRA